MRLRVIVRRAGLRDVRLLWRVPEGVEYPVSQLVAHIHDVLPLGDNCFDGSILPPIADFIVELLDGSGGPFECLHFQQITDILKEDDQVLIRCLRPEELNARIASSRILVNEEGQATLDGVSYGTLHNPDLPQLPAPSDDFDDNRTRPSKRQRTSYSYTDSDSRPRYLRSAILSHAVSADTKSDRLAHQNTMTQSRLLTHGRGHSNMRAHSNSSVSSQETAIVTRPESESDSESTSDSKSDSESDSDAPPDEISSKPSQKQGLLTALDAEAALKAMPALKKHKTLSNELANVAVSSSDSGDDDESEDGSDSSIQSDSSSEDSTSEDDSDSDSSSSSDSGSSSDSESDAQPSKPVNNPPVVAQTQPAHKTKTQKRNERRRLLAQAKKAERAAAEHAVPAATAEVDELEKRRQALLRSIAGYEDLAGPISGSDIPPTAPEPTSEPAPATTQVTILPCENWHEKINLTAVECVQEGLHLPDPPFPFVQRWHKTKNSKRKRRDWDEPVAEEPLPYDDADIVPASQSDQYDYEDEGHVPDTQLDHTEEDDDQGEDLPEIPADISALPPLLPGAAVKDMIITYKKWILSKTTQWQPVITSVVALIKEVHDDATMTVQLSRRDLQKDRPEKEYDEYSGRRIYSGFEAPDDDEDEEDDNNGLELISFEDLTEPQIIHAPADVQIPDGTCKTGGENEDATSDKSESVGDVIMQDASVSEGAPVPTPFNLRLEQAEASVLRFTSYSPSRQLEGTPSVSQGGTNDAWEAEVEEDRPIFSFLDDNRDEPYLSSVNDNPEQTADLTQSQSPCRLPPTAFEAVPPTDSTTTTTTSSTRRLASVEQPSVLESTPSGTPADIDATAEVITLPRTQHPSPIPEENVRPGRTFAAPSQHSQDSQVSSPLPLLNEILSMGSSQSAAKRPRHFAGDNSDSAAVRRLIPFDPAGSQVIDLLSSDDEDGAT